MYTNQYSVTEYRQAQRHGSGRLPGVYLLYDFSPVSMELQETRRGLWHLLVRLCAVVGGCFAVTGMIDRWVHRAVSAARGGGQQQQQQQYGGGMKAAAGAGYGANGTYAGAGGYGAAPGAGYGGPAAAAVGAFGAAPAAFHHQQQPYNNGSGAAPAVGVGGSYNAYGGASSYAAQRGSVAGPRGSALGGGAAFPPGYGADKRAD